MGGASSAAYQNSLAGVGVPPAELFTREAIQNSVDAASKKGRRVTVSFRSEEIEGSELRRFRDALDLSEEAEPLTRHGLFPAGGHKTLGNLLTPPLRLLYVEDFDTVGLGGTILPEKPTEEDNYFRLCLALGDTRAAEGGGGTFGYGKSVYWLMSSLWTIVVYSRFRPTARTKGASQRLIGISWFTTHTKRDSSGKDIRYTGRAWFGNAEPNRCRPVTDADAASLADTLGFLPRRGEDLGTSILIVGSQVSTDALTEGVEKHWWPRLLDGRLGVRLSRGGQDLTQPSPRANPTLNRFVRSWDLANGNSEPTGRDTIKDLAYKGVSLGRFAISTGSDDTDEEFGEPSGPTRQSEIALVRDPGMVVDYLSGPALSPTQPTSQGVYLGDPGMNSTYAASEPPAHNQWDAGTIRRDRPLSGDQRKQIEQTLTRIKQAARAFIQSKQAPLPKPPPRCRELEKLLGKYLGGETDWPPPPPPTTDPFRIHFIDEVSRSESDAGIVLDAKLQVSLREDPELAPENLVRVRAWVDSLVDDGHPAPRADRLDMDYMSARETDGRETPGESDEQGSFVDLVLSPGGPPQVVDLRSQPLRHPEYRASLSILVEKLE